MKFEIPRLWGIWATKGAQIKQDEREIIIEGILKKRMERGGVNAFHGVNNDITTGKVQGPGSMEYSEDLSHALNERKRKKLREENL